MKSTVSFVPEWVFHVDWSGLPPRVLHCAAKRERRRYKIVKIHRYRGEQPVHPESGKIKVEQREEDDEDEWTICRGGDDNDEDEGIN